MSVFYYRCLEMRWIRKSLQFDSDFVSRKLHQRLGFVCKLGLVSTIFWIKHQPNWLALNPQQLHYGCPIILTHTQWIKNSGYNYPQGRRIKKVAIRLARAQRRVLSHNCNILSLHKQGAVYRVLGRGKKMDQNSTKHELAKR